VAPDDPVDAVDFARMADGHESDAIRAVEIGTLGEASTAVARLLSVTKATMERRAQLEGALQSRVVIEQAKGILAERHEMDVEVAFGVIRRAARTNRVKLQDLARRVRPGEPDPPEIAAALAAGARDRTSHPRG
jgi:ANTAR domain